MVFASEYKASFSQARLRSLSHVAGKVGRVPRGDEWHREVAAASTWLLVRGAYANPNRHNDEHQAHHEHDAAVI